MLGISYFVISSTNYCGHVEGGYPARCYVPRYIRVDASECQDKCTLHDLCIAYSVQGRDCSLMTSTGSCPNGWQFFAGNMATQRSDIIPSDDRDSNCMAKGIS